jgi:hypothetical protein
LQASINCINLIYIIRNREIDENTKLCSFDIENVHTSIPVAEVKNIMKELFDNDNQTPEKEKHES